MIFMDGVYTGVTLLPWEVKKYAKIVGYYGDDSGFCYCEKGGGEILNDGTLLVDFSQCNRRCTSAMLLSVCCSYISANGSFRFTR
ncbi:hypothetical protein L1987_60409 [Smallanthus sonchifolius]|uniref:Uncharacterized protein n=1 Tax=Smallanthus sonchifolius TaxID=185202 RepID=A0ACB9D8D0_9ASTR|nr:hypothetical protein L1987_60409 [Smallanthus sonchifolius]